MALLATILLITKGGDIGAYLIGLRFGRTPLLPRISPKKTVEGSIGGLIFSVLGALAGNHFLNLSYPHIIALGVIFGIIGQLFKAFGQIIRYLFINGVNLKFPQSDMLIS